MLLKQLTAASVAATLCVCAQAAPYKDGTYTAAGIGNASKIQVEVIVSNGKISSVKVLKHGETKMLLEAAEKKLAKAIVKKNGTDGVSAVTGATNSSKGIIEAVNKALEAAK